jgi:hypothetical protein
MFTSERATESGATFYMTDAKVKRDGSLRKKPPVKLPKLSRALNWLEKVSPPKILLIQEPDSAPGQKKARRSKAN